MKTVALFTLFLMGFTIPKPEVNQIELSEAIKTKTIIASFSGRSGSTHYLKPLTASIRNLKNKEISILIPAGYHFVSEDSTIQDIIITQEELLVLKPKEVKDVYVSGMCIQHNNSAPRGDDGFKLKGWANAKLKRLALYLDEKNMQDYQGQQAMWSVSDGEDLSNIVGLGTQDERELIGLVAIITGKPNLSEEQYEEYKREVFSPVYKAELKGKFVMNFSRKVPIHIAIFDDNGIVLQEIYNRVAPKGKQEVTYTFDALPYEGKTIHAKLIAFDDVLIDRVIEL